jgi:hypothetical protein
MLENVGAATKLRDHLETSHREDIEDPKKTATMIIALGMVP